VRYNGGRDYPGGEATMSTSESSASQPVWTIPESLRAQLLAALSATEAPAARMSYEAFLDWANEDTLAEWVNGEVIMVSPASARHQQIVNLLVSVLSTFTRIHDLGLVLDGPFQMKLANSGREPDILFVAKSHLDRLKSTYLDGPADLVIEVLSPESISRDCGEKFAEYQAAAIPEYWLIDPQAELAELYHLDAKGSYQLIAADDEGRYHSQVLPDLWLRLAWLWADPLPDAEDLLLEIDCDAYARDMIERLRKRGYLGQDDTP